MAQLREGKYASMRTKVAWTALLLMCFLIGRNIHIPFLYGTATGKGAGGEGLLNAANVFTGGNFFYPSVFSLGLGPWMGAAILWRFLFIGRFARGRKIPEKTVDRARNTLMVILAVFQSISLMAMYTVDPMTWGPLSQRVVVQIFVVLILTGGAVLVAWLAKQNENFGLGGITMFIFYQIIITVMGNLGALPATVANSQYTGVLWFVLVACIGVVLVGVFVGNAEMRLHINKVSIDNGFMGVSYLPIKLNPAGASPIMYAAALLAIPQFVVNATSQLVPGASTGAYRFLSMWGLSSPVGFTSYLILLFALTIFFGLFTVDPKQTAMRMQDSGEYLDYVPPGQATRQFIRSRVTLLSALSGVFLVVLTGLPLYYIGRYPDLQFVLTAPQTLMILLSLLWLLNEEIADTMIGRKYSFTLGVTPGRAVA
ncbi:MAG: hypothetical protein FWG16_00780 [Micrococcales bacterium]|nr:hypothetical protein [Micrococcales bacterium]